MEKLKKHRKVFWQNQKCETLCQDFCVYLGQGWNLSFAFCLFYRDTFYHSILNATHVCDKKYGKVWAKRNIQTLVSTVFGCSISTDDCQWFINTVLNP